MMETAIKHPQNCGESTKVGGTFICNLDCKPCPVAWDKRSKCALERLDELTDAFAKLVWGDRT